MRQAVGIIFAIIFLSFLVGIFSCNPSKRAARKIERYKEKHPELFQTKKDTTWKPDTTISAGVKKDTVFKKEVIKDTVTIIKDRLIIRYYETDSSRYIGGECLPDTIYKQIPYVTEKETVIVKEELPWWIYALIAGLILLLLLLIFRRR